MSSIFYRFTINSYCNLISKEIFSRPINEIAQVYGQRQTAIAGAERVFAVLDEADEDHSGEELIKED